ncbi:putative phosphoglycerate mutase family protein [Microthyrium microscopicum]|uniref:Putative phosphoglycerate mutase family protein n=1 Tax=Microthyrium microscopicum TaxID=703497 RepID=A0A6A6UNP6_9PEZI|nr:putative phosphoglycerate mutase family protein [Microthyrium microscopicum]
MRSSIIIASLLGLVAAGPPTVYLIRHGEKPDSGNGLSAQGVQRSQCLPNVFGYQSSYYIAKIIAQTPQSDGSQQRPYDTVVPLSQNLGIPIDTSCQRDDQKCVAKLVNNYTGSGNILICWEHDALSDIVQALGAKKVPTYPSSDYGIIWTDVSPYTSVDTSGVENCPGLPN